MEIDKVNRGWQNEMLRYSSVLHRKTFIGVSPRTHSINLVMSIFIHCSGILTIDSNSRWGVQRDDKTTNPSAPQLQTCNKVNSRWSNFHPLNTSLPNHQEEREKHWHRRRSKLDRLWCVLLRNNNSHHYNHHNHHNHHIQSSDNLSEVLEGFSDDMCHQWSR